MTEPDWERYRAGVPRPASILGVSWSRVTLALLLAALLSIALLVGRMLGPRLWHEMRPWSEADRIAGAHCVDPVFGTAPSIAARLGEDATAHGAARVTWVKTSLGPRDADGTHLAIVDYLLIYRDGYPVDMRARGLLVSQDCSVASLTIDKFRF